MNKPFPAEEAKPSDASSADVGGADLKALLGRDLGAAHRSKLLIAVGVIIVLIVAGVLAVRALHRPASPNYLTAAARRGDFVVTVSATGTLQPIKQVDVGSEISGTIDEVTVDDNDPVRRGEVLASLDVSRLRDQITQGEAALQSAKANELTARATLREAQIRSDRLHTLLQLSNGDAPARTDLDAADAALDRAQAGLAAAEAAIDQAAAALNTDRTTLSKATIRSPIDGVVLSRKIQPGQTVAASLQAPVLFSLAEDLRRMELDVDIDEADVGQVREGQRAAFTVDAYPGRDYPATITRVGLGSVTKEGVVTYTGVLSVDNADLTLRPGMTASAEITSERRAGVLLVPVAALQYRPAVQSGGAGLAGALTPRLPRLGAPQARRSSDPNAQQVWVLRQGRAEAVTVQVGSSNGREAEIRGGALAAGDQVIVGTMGAGDERP